MGGVVVGVVVEWLCWCGCVVVGGWWWWWCFEGLGVGGFVYWDDLVEWGFDKVMCGGCGVV